VWGIPFVVGLARSGAEPLSGPLRVGNSGQVAEWFKAAVLKATGAGDLCAKNGVWLQGVSVSPIRRVVSPISLS
jgi:hypothetical protein